MGLFDKLNNQINTNKISEVQMSDDEKTNFEMNFIFNGPPTMPIEINEKEGNGIYYSSRFSRRIDNPWEPTDDAKSTQEEIRNSKEEHLKKISELQEDYDDEVGELFMKLLNMYYTYSELYEKASEQSAKEKVKEDYKKKARHISDLIDSHNNGTKYKEVQDKIHIYKTVNPDTVDFDLDLADYYLEKNEEKYGD